MEIEVPDFNDIKFEELCRCCQGTRKYQRWDPLPRERDKAGKLKPQRNAPTTVDCTFCDARGMAPTVVGERLLDFLAARRALSSPEPGGTR
jgi:hypothetical protein